MGFYEDFAICYDAIFPVDPTTLKFLETTFSSSSKTIIDFACGTGGYAVALAGCGHQVIGIDLASSMINVAQGKNKFATNLRFVVGDIRQPELGDLVCQGWYCIGNSLVHLTESAVRDALGNWRKLLKPGQPWVLQILNYDRIFQQKVTKLPTLQGSNGTMLVREYEIISEQEIIFKTQLTCGGNTYPYQTVLYPLTRRRLQGLLEESGLSINGEYGDFDQSPWTPESFAYVIRGW